MTNVPTPHEADEGPETARTSTLGGATSPGTSYGSPPQSASAESAFNSDAEGSHASGKNIAQTAQEQAAGVAGETKRQANDLLQQSWSKLQDQTSHQQQRLAEALRSLSQELSAIKEKSDRNGVVSDVTQQAVHRVEAAADWLSHQEANHMLDDVRGFARRRPAIFLTAAMGVGVLAGRVSRGLQASDGNLAFSLGSEDNASTTKTASDSARPTPIHDALIDSSTSDDGLVSVNYTEK
ncbi:MAG: hypothetical protein ACRCTR_06165 [Actinomycetota bacterium]